MASDALERLAAKLAAERKKRAVWEKAGIVPGRDPEHYRLDDFGSLIRYADYGTRLSDYGWQFDRTPPAQRQETAGHGAGDEVANLRPLHWRNDPALGRLISRGPALLTGQRGG